MAYGAFIVGGGSTIPRIGDAIVTTVKTSPAARYKNTTWELVAQNRVPMGAGDGHKGGETVEAGLPNIKGGINPSYGSFMWAKGTNSGAFGDPSGGAHEHYTNSYTDDFDAPTGIAGLVFDASFSNPIYGASNTVQPPAYYFYFWRRVS